MSIRRRIQTSNRDTRRNETVKLSLNDFLKENKSQKTTICRRWVRQENFCDSLTKDFEPSIERERQCAGTAGVVGFNDYLEKRL